MAIGKNIKFHRKTRLGWTLADLEEKSSVDRGTISALENRDSSKSDHFVKIAHGLGLTMEELLIEPADWNNYSLLKEQGIKDDGWSIKYPEGYKYSSARFYEKV